MFRVFDFYFKGKFVFLFEAEKAQKKTNKRRKLEEERKENR